MRLIRSSFTLIMGAAAVAMLVAAHALLLRAFPGPREPQQGPACAGPPHRAEPGGAPPSSQVPALPAIEPPPPPPVTPALVEPKPAPVPFATRPWLGVASSPDRSDVVAVWNDKEVWVSRDGGGTFRADLYMGAKAAAVGTDGTVYAVIDDCRLAVIDRNGHARLLDGTYCQPQLLAARGKWLVAISTSYPDRTNIQVSADGGESWDLLAPPSEEEGGTARPFGITDVAIGADGSITLAGQEYQGGECAASYDFLWRIRRGKIEAGTPWPGIIYDAPMFVGTDGWTYTTCAPSDGLEEAGCAVDPRGELHVLPGSKLSSQALVVRGRRAAFLFDGGRITLATKGSSRLVATDAPRGFTAAAIDAKDRVYGLLAGNLVSWSESGWRMHLGYVPDPDEGDAEED
jgi:hypothetical protein